MSVTQTKKAFRKFRRRVNLPARFLRGDYKNRPKTKTVKKPAPP